MFLTGLVKWRVFFVWQIVSRDHPDFKVLTDMAELDKMVNKAISLPVLGDELPKELGMFHKDMSKVPPILLTQQRVDIIKRFFKEVCMNQDHVKMEVASGLILSAPIGQGKSIMSYLLACAAYANNCVLLYIVRHCQNAVCLCLLPLL